jgi:hypothetical protein
VEIIQICYSDCVKAGQKGKNIEKKNGNRRLILDVGYDYKDTNKAYVFVLYSPTSGPIDETIDPLDTEENSTWTSPCGLFQVIYEVK